MAGAIGVTVRGTPGGAVLFSHMNPTGVVKNHHAAGRC
jgi:hypothetical protein